jgi:hypothetical protein
MITHANRAAESAAEATFLLDSLKKAHANLLSAIEELAKLTRGPAPDKGRLVAIRWNVSDASLIRRLLWGRIHAYLANFPDPDLERDLRRLQGIDIALIRMSAKHVAAWPAEVVLEDWAGYNRASKLMRATMTDAISEEKRLLYPILEAIANQAGAE